jgi:D-glycero-alpha-D-manno-heptose-7-phosphate kinase
MVDSLDELQHELVREALRMTQITHQIELATMGDIPSEGSGLGSSSTVTVGCLNALYAYRGCLVDAELLAQQACKIEIETLGKPIGKQDQYIAAYGGLRFIRFRPDDSVVVESIGIDDEVRRALNEHLLLFYTGTTRRASTILKEQVAHMNESMGMLRALKDLAWEGRQKLEHGDVDSLGEAMHRGWEIKRGLANGISNDSIDEMYQAARKAGALGGKITGAGGGGFMMLYCPHQHHDRVRHALRGLRELPFRLERDGTKVIFNGKRD